MTHEQSETIQLPDGSWVNVYGHHTPQAGQQLPGTQTYPTAQEAVAAAVARSNGLSPGAAQVMQQAQDFKGYLDPKIEAIKKALNEAQYKAGVAVFGQDPPTNALPGDRIIGDTEPKNW